MLHNPQENLLFPKFSIDELQDLLDHGHERTLAPGEIIFAEGNPTRHFYVVLDGMIQVTKTLAGHEQVLTVHQPGEFTGDISMLTGGIASATGKALGASRVLEVEPDAFRRLVTECSQTAAVILTALAGRSHEVGAHLQQQEKMAALGKLSAGLAHELNNPAAAGRRAAKQLRDAMKTVQAKTLELCDQQLTDPQRQALIDLQQSVMTCQLKHYSLDPLEQSDREDALADWLDDHSIPDGWKLAPTFVSAGIDDAQIQHLADRVGDSALPGALGWLESSLNVAELVDQVEQTTERISELVTALKSYAYMDKSPLQEINVHDGIENTLTIMHHKLKKGITVHRDYDPNLPKICAYGGELNQVWTNLIDNAIDAMEGNGDLTLRTTHLHDQIQIELIDNGPGIPPDVQSRIFEPFFTTKDVGKGTGLGLDIVRRIVVNRHGGSIRVDSKPGKTCFLICLPMKPPKTE
ncbi:MAG: ATP-binding protein [Elainellaceae cyanobacterium]